MPDPRAPRVPDFLYGTAWKEDRTQALVETALRTGFRGIDTANQRRHYFEAAVGQGLAAVYGSGMLTRADLFLQTKFTYRNGQDHRLPYDPAADLPTQVSQSMASSLEHLGTDHVDSYVLHGPASGHGWTDDDAVTWAAMARERDAGRTRLLGVSNVSLRHLVQMAASGAELPAFVQNRCFARFGWDRDVRAFCAERGIVYQGFSLLTANLDAVRHPLIARIAARANATLPQVVFRFAQAVGMLPLTGTSDAQHMAQDLKSRDLDPRPPTTCAPSSRSSADGWSPDHDLPRDRARREERSPPDLLSGQRRGARPLDRVRARLAGAVDQLAASASLLRRSRVPDGRARTCAATADRACYARHEDYALEHIVKDMIELLDALGREKAIWVGHDWGSPVVWSLASHHPERCVGVANLCVPYLAEGLHAGGAAPARRPRHLS